MSGSGLAGYILRRLAVAVPLLFLISFGVFALVNLAPGDPVRALIGSRPANAETIAAIREEFHLNDPFLVQYGKWLGQVVQGDLGRSITGNRPVIRMIGDRLGVTVYLTLLGSFLVLTVGVALGMLAAFRSGSRLDRGVVMLGVLGISSPPFVTGIFLLYIFGVVLGWFPTFGPGHGFFDRLWHLVLPAFALALSVMAIVTKITRTSAVEELDKD